MKHKKWLTCLSGVLIAVLCLTQAVSADSLAADSGSVRQAYIDIGEQLRDLSVDDQKSFEEFGIGLAESLKTADNQDAAVEDYFTEHTNSVLESIKSTIKEAKETAGVDEIELQGAVSKDLVNVYTIDENRTLIVTPTYVCIDTLTVYEDTISNSIASIQSTSSKSATCSKTYYGLTGNVLFSLSVSCSFYYNGSSAWYKSGYDRNYSAGSLAVWHVYNWDGDHYASGTSHVAYCSGQFKWGFNYADVGLVVQTYDCINTLACYKTGIIEKDSVDY